MISTSLLLGGERKMLEKLKNNYGKLNMTAKSFINNGKVLADLIPTTITE